jgi:hypothetical protein
MTAEIEKKDRIINRIKSKVIETTEIEKCLYKTLLKVALQIEYVT